MTDALARGHGRAMRSSAWLFVLLLSACGGKIVETAPIAETTPVDGDERKSDGQQGTLAPPPPPAPTGAPAPASVTPLDACEVLCERDARCDTTLPALPVNQDESGDCRTRCEKRLAGKCGIDDWLLCFASAITPNACTPLPEECKPAFCSWARCAKQPVSNCE
jgi:hypothetical protein